MEKLRTRVCFVFGIVCILLCVLPSAGADADSEQPLHGTGHYRNEVVHLALDREHAQELLPDGLELDEPPANWPYPDRHPVTLQFGTQFGVHPVIHGHPFPESLHWNYSEFIVGVLYVKFSDGRPGTYAHIPRLFLDHLPAIAAGYAYAFPKEPAWVARNRDYYEVRSPSRRTKYLSASFVPKGVPRPLRELPNFEASAGMFELPLVSRSHLGHFICADFHWDVEHAKGYPVDAEVDIEFPFLAPLTPGLYRATGLDKSLYGAFRMNIDWTISPPRPCY